MPLGNAGWGAWKMGKWAEKGSSGDRPEERGRPPKKQEEEGVRRVEEPWSRQGTGSWARVEHATDLRYPHRLSYSCVTSGLTLKGREGSPWGSDRGQVWEWSLE